ncbi:hypothetical protein PPL_05181 [Heterostelium album PN500]|uniref:F-box domain-containing protein n=1 Tax=Heterostelium pallidum (strain ATCC 26659 / Pp 5 / PN500) TaxID=670386 RepID=D3B9N5_HETP5|nr:hypothetical protein PPL_05181 [Heterostelium album PN500]EFA81947.1 hypothetical protein PPL_05181 [Heterostelium album PN500]|eukprot:XP_020434064.1 hypothetical protein PPL_05181 [Heterostelium album PN500]
MNSVVVGVASTTDSASSADDEVDSNSASSPSSSLTSTSSTSTTSILINEINSNLVLSDENGIDDQDIDFDDNNNNNSSYNDSSSNNNNNNNNNNKHLTLISLPIEIIDKILHHLNQSTLSILCMVSHEWNKIINALWHTIDLSKSHHHFTHLSTKMKMSIQSLKRKSGNKNNNNLQDNEEFLEQTTSSSSSLSSSSSSSSNQHKKKISSLESIVNNLISNYGFLIPGLGADKSPPIFQRHNRNLLKTKDAQLNISNQFDMRTQQFFVDMSQRRSVCSCHPDGDETSVSVCWRDAARRRPDSARRLRIHTTNGVARTRSLLQDDRSIDRKNVEYTVDSRQTTNHRTESSHSFVGRGNPPVWNELSDTMASIFMACPHLGSIDVGGCVNIDDTALEAISINCLELFQLNKYYMQSIVQSNQSDLKTRTFFTHFIEKINILSRFVESSKVNSIQK